MNYEFHPEAEMELIESAARYESAVPGLGERFGDEIERVIALLLENPSLGVALENELRHFLLRRFPYAIVYADVRGVLYIIAVAHGSRKPGYWEPRVNR